MSDKLFFSKLITKDLTAIDSNRRLFEGVLTVEMKDKQGEITVRDELLKVLPIWIARGGPITDTHSNRVVGQGINFQATTVTDSDGQNYPAITIQGEIFKDYELDDEIWKSITNGTYKGLSFGGATKSDRTPIMQKDGSVAYSLKDLEQYEVAVCEEPAVPLALITAHNQIAKAMAGCTTDRGDGKMCIRCDKFKCYVEKDNFGDATGANTPNKDEEAEALENNRGEPQENGATYHGTDKGRTHTCDAEVREINNVEVGDKPSGQSLVKDDDKAMDEDNPEALEEAGLEEEKKEVTFGDAADKPAEGIYGNKNPYDNNPGSAKLEGAAKPKVMGKDTRQKPEKKIGHGRFNNNSTGGDFTGAQAANAGPKKAPMSAARLASRARRAGIKSMIQSIELLNLLLKIKLPGKIDHKREGAGTVKPPKVPNNNKPTTESQTPASVNPKADNMEHGSVSDASTSHFQATHLDPDLASKLASGSCYNTDDVIRDYCDEKESVEVEKTNTCTNTYTEPARGGFAGREPGETCDTSESTSIHNVNQPKHVNRPYEQDDPDAFNEEKKKTDRSFTANNSEDGINGKMRLDDDEESEAFTEKGDFAVNNPGMGSGGIRVGASYDNAQQDTGQKDNPRKVQEERYNGEEDRGKILNPRETKTEEANVPKDSVSGSANVRYNKAALELTRLILDLKTKA